MDQNLCTFLEWDTEFFAKQIARVNSSHLTKEQALAIDTWSAENQIDCLYFLAAADDPDTVRVAEDYHYRLQDVRMVFELDLTKMSIEQAITPAGFELAKASPADTNKLLSFVANAFTLTRFYHDKHFTTEQCNRLYETWLIRSIEENFADVVMILSYQELISAFISCDLDQETATGSIGLVGVAENMRGRQLGFRIVQHALDYFQQQEMKSVTVVTQGRNIPAQRLYQKCGFRTKDVKLWYHKWFDS